MSQTRSNKNAVFDIYPVILDGSVVSRVRNAILKPASGLRSVEAWELSKNFIGEYVPDLLERITVSGHPVESVLVSIKSGPGLIRTISHGIRQKTNETIYLPVGQRIALFRVFDSPIGSLPLGIDVVARRKK